MNSRYNLDFHFPTSVAYNYIKRCCSTKVLINYIICTFYKHEYLLKITARQLANKGDIRLSEPYTQLLAFASLGIMSLVIIK
jgi:hypothetical protein